MPLKMEQRPVQHKIRLALAPTLRKEIREQRIITRQRFPIAKPTPKSANESKDKEEAVECESTKCNQTASHGSQGVDAARTRTLTIVSFYHQEHTFSKTGPKRRLAFPNQNIKSQQPAVDMLLPVTRDDLGTHPLGIRLGREDPSRPMRVVGVSDGGTLMSPVTETHDHRQVSFAVWVMG